ncbi:MAG TPA: hypothetical protein VL463_18010 [Kofleriaceae bacterium]|nr:hypothetical protein [Kofleriaceae bacterium]
MEILSSWWFVPTIVGLVANGVWLLVAKERITIGRADDDGVADKISFGIALIAVVVLGPIAAYERSPGVIGAAMMIAAGGWSFPVAYMFFTWIDRADWMPPSRVPVPRSRALHGALAIVMTLATTWSILYPVVRWPGTSMKVNPTRTMSQ